MYKEYGEVIENASLQNYNTYRILTYAKYLIKPYSINNLNKLIIKLKEDNIRYYILGKGSNVILPDNYFNGVIISLEKINKIEINGNVIYAEAGAILNDLVLKTVHNNLKGLENLASIPGSVGGAIKGNAGANGSEIFDFIKEVIVLREDTILTIPKKDIIYSYRYTMFKENNDIIIGCYLELQNGSEKELLAIINNNKEKRKNTQPLNLPNAGCVFKNPEGFSAGKLIDDLGLKGFSINDAKISEVHANFIVNNGKCHSEDIKNLIAYVKDKVYNEYNINLELEQVIVEWE